MDALANKDGNGNHGSHEEQVHDYSEESEDTHATEEASEEDREDGVKGCSTGKTLHSAPCVGDTHVTLDESGDEVGPDANDTRSAEEVEDVEQGTNTPKGCTASRWHGEDVLEGCCV